MSGLGDCRSGLTIMSSVFRGLLDGAEVKMMESVLHSFGRIERDSEIFDTFFADELLALLSFLDGLIPTNFDKN